MLSIEQESAGPIIIEHSNKFLICITLLYNLLYCVVYLEYLRGQMAECRQGLYSTWLPTHSLPVAGQLRVLMLVPSPQVTEQELQVDQPVQSASTVNRRGILL